MLWWMDRSSCWVLSLVSMQAKFLSQNIELSPTSQEIHLNSIHYHSPKVKRSLRKFHSSWRVSRETASQMADCALGITWKTEKGQSLDNVREKYFLTGMSVTPEFRLSPVYGTISQVGRHPFLFWASFPVMKNKEYWLLCFSVVNL